MPEAVGSIIRGEAQNSVSESLNEVGQVKRSKLFDGGFDFAEQEDESFDGHRGPQRRDAAARGPDGGVRMANLLDALEGRAHRAGSQPASCLGPTSPFIAG